MKNNKITFKNKLFDLEARLDTDFECGPSYWVVLEFGPTHNYFPAGANEEDRKGRRFIWQFYTKLSLFHLRLSDRDKFGMDK